MKLECIKDLYEDNTLIFFKGDVVEIKEEDTCEYIEDRFGDGYPIGFSDDVLSTYNLFTHFKPVEE